MENLEFMKGNQTLDSSELIQPAIQEKSIKTRLISFKYGKGGEQRSVEVDKSVIDYAKKYEVSENINLYSQKMNATIHPCVPCCALEEGEEITIIKRQFKSKKIILSSLPNPNYDMSKEGIFFKVSCTGSTEGNSPKTICNPEHIWGKNNLAVYGQMDQTIKQAIQNDKRFNIISDFRLKNKNESKPYHSDVRLSSLNRAVVYTVLIKNEMPKSKPNRKTETQKTKGLQSSDKAKDFKDAGKIRPEVPQTSSDPQSEPEGQKLEMPKIYKTSRSNKFSQEFDVLTKHYSSRVWRMDIINDAMQYKKPMQADTFKRLTQQMENVALIRYKYGEGYKSGTFFLLTNTLGLTCLHFLEAFLGFDCKPEIFVIFNYDNESANTEQYTAVVEFYRQQYDFAFLRISTQSKPGLLRSVAPPPQDGAVSIIGHPDGKSKKIDPYCSVINYSKRAETIAGNILCDRSNVHVITEQNLMAMSQPELVTYDTCLYWGASGSPVFNYQGDLVAMHTGGYPVNTDLDKKSIIEYGRNIIDILLCGVRQFEEIHSWFVEKPKHDSLATYMEAYLKPGGHSVNMQPVIREYLKCIQEKNGSLQGQNPDFDDSGIADSTMDTSV